jgi:hypothetical protein
MSYSVVFRCATPDVPAATKERVRFILDEIGESCGSISPDDGFWLYIKESGMTLEFEQWRFQYRIDRAAGELIVYGCQRLREAAPGKGD